MNRASAVHCLAVPHLAAQIPVSLVLPGKGGLSPALAIALLEANIITDKMLAPRRNAPLTEAFAEPDEGELAARALSTWWDGLRKKHRTRYFRWELHVQELDYTPRGYCDDQHATGWFCMTRSGADMPRFALERATLKLEAVLEGFGQTILAVLFDATLLLPESLNPWLAVGFAEWLHWNDSENDEELLENLRQEGQYETVAELLANEEILTRAAFYANMPRWVTAPRRVVSREQIVAASRDKFSRDVVAACDALLAVVSAPGFVPRSHEAGCAPAGFDCTDGCMVLLWRENDEISQAIDDGINHLWDSGDATETIAMHPVPLNAAGVRQCQDRIEQTLELAVKVERLLELIGEPL